MKNDSVDSVSPVTKLLNVERNHVVAPPRRRVALPSPALLHQQPIDVFRQESRRHTRKWRLELQQASRRFCELTGLEQLQRPLVVVDLGRTQRNDIRRND